MGKDSNKTADVLLIKSYMRHCRGAVAVEDVIRFSGADKLRVYPILFELERAGVVEVLKRDVFGAPLELRVS